MKCRHTKPITVPGSTRCYTHSVATWPITDENPAAHGNTTHTERCAKCGWQRSVNSNGAHSEESAWYDPATIIR